MSEFAGIRAFITRVCAVRRSAGNGRSDERVRSSVFHRRTGDESKRCTPCPASFFHRRTGDESKGCGPMRSIGPYAHPEDCIPKPPFRHRLTAMPPPLIVEASKALPPKGSPIRGCGVERRLRRMQRDEAGTAVAECKRASARAARCGHRKPVLAARYARTEGWLTRPQPCLVL